MKKVLITALFFAYLLLGNLLGQRYYLPLPVASNNNRPLTDKTVALYDCTGATSMYSLTWDKGATYYSSTLPTTNYYDVKLYNSGSWLTLYNNVYLTYAASVNYDSLRAYIIVDSSTIRWVGDSLAVYAIDSSEITNASITNNKVKAAPAYNYVLASISPYGYAVWSKVDSSMITNGSIDGNDFANTIFSFQPDSGIYINGYNNTSLTYTPNMTLNFDMKVDLDTAFNFESRELVLRDGGAASGIKYQKFNANVWDTLRHTVSDYYFATEAKGYESYDTDSISVSDTLALNASAYYGTYKWIDPDGTVTGNLQTYHLYIMCEPKEYQYLWGQGGGDPSTVIEVMFRGVDTDSTNMHWTFDIYNLLGSNVDSAPKWYYPQSANTWTKQTFSTSDVVLTSLLNEPFLLDITIKVKTVDSDYTCDFAYIKFLYRTQ